MGCVDQVLDGVSLRLAKSSFVGNLEELRDLSNIHLIMVGNLFKPFLLLHQLWQLDVNGGSHCGSKVGWATGDVTEMVVVSESEIVLKVFNSSAKSVEDLDDRAVLLHGDDSKLILFVNPDHEVLVVVVKDSSAGWPVSV